MPFKLAPLACTSFVPLQRNTVRAGPSTHTFLPSAHQGRLPPPPSRGGVQEQSAKRCSDGRTNSLPHVNHNQWLDTILLALHGIVWSGILNMALPHTSRSFRYPLLRVDRNAHRFWIRGWVTDFCFSTGAGIAGRTFVIYEDPVHIRW